MLDFKSMYEILEERETENFKLEKFEIKEYHFRGIPIGKYVRLIDKNISFYNCIMSDTPMEHNTNRRILNMANGDVLIGGLGIGMILMPLMEKEEVKSITIIEKEQEIIDMVASQLPLNDKVKIINGNIYDNTFPRGTKFDTIYFDIWNTISTDDYEDMKYLKKLYKRCLRSKKENPNAWIGSWAEYEAKNGRRLL